MAKVFVVQGMHRSATSLIAKALHDQGVHMGDHLLGATADQPHGHYEDVELIRINDRMLDTLGGAWNDPPPRADIGRIPVDEPVRYIESRRGPHLWGMKDPRLVITWPVWRKAFAVFEFDVHLISNLRRPEKVTASLQRRDGNGNWGALWDRYHADMVQNLTEWKPS